MLPGRMLCGCTPSSWPPTGEQRCAAAPSGPADQAERLGRELAADLLRRGAGNGVAASCPADTSATGTITHEPHTRDGSSGRRARTAGEKTGQDSGQSRPGDDGKDRTDGAAARRRPPQADIGQAAAATARRARPRGRPAWSRWSAPARGRGPADRARGRAARPGRPGRGRARRERAAGPSAAAGRHCGRRRRAARRPEAAGQGGPGGPARGPAVQRRPVPVLPRRPPRPRRCAKAKVPFEIVPGVPTATAVPAYAGIPLTSDASRRRARHPRQRGQPRRPAGRRHAGHPGRREPARPTSPRC